MDEKEILKFWKENKIFEKTLAKDSPMGEFVFYDGPPFATGLPHYGSLLASIAKDIFGRYKTMRGYNVRRRWGWDCHGLPIENMIEKRLGLKSKKDIEAMGVEKFNEICRSTVLETAGAWKEYIERVGRWVEFDNAYMTMDNDFMESVWWALKQLWDKGLIYEGRKVLLYCPRCETPLAKAEVAMDNSYKTVTEDALTVKFKLKPGQKIGGWTTDDNTFILAWTTTPWTLPSNVALAINKDIVYCNLKSKISNLSADRQDLKNKKTENFILAKKRLNILTEPYEIVNEFSGEKIVGLEYEPLYEIPPVKVSGKKSHYVISADFVTTEEGTGVVHIAPVHGEDDYNVGVQHDLPIIPLLDSGGYFNPPAGGEAPEFIQGFYLKKGEKYIKEDLEKRGLIFAKQAYSHSYPHCHRCETPLYYSALSSWFINIAKIKNRLVQLNEKINWHPEHLKHGRFLNIVKDAPDWNISRNRYWASPLPIWKCQGNLKSQISNLKSQKVSCENQILVGSVDELKKHTKKSGNKYFVMRHGRAESNEKNIVSSKLENSHKYPLTDKGKEQAMASAKNLIARKIDLILYSPFERTKETAFIVAEKIGLAKENLISDSRLMEINSEILDGNLVQDYRDYFFSTTERMFKVPSEGESLHDVKKRMGEFLYEMERKYSNKNILIVSHEYPLWMLCAVNLGLDEKKSLKTKEKKDDFIGTGEFMELPFVPLPHNRDFILDFHRPYIDEVKLICADCGGAMERTPEVLDGWFESAAMPFAEHHYPFENKEQFEKRFPGDFVAEYIAQTRTWFYYMHAIASALFGDVSFKNVISTGTISAEDGTKMSKSKGNYTDPMLNMDKFGADALRYYLMTSPVMQAEDIKFSDNEIKDARLKIINILWNSFVFFDLYQKEYDGKTSASDSDSVLDQWILARLRQLTVEVSENLDRYDTVKAGRPIRDFVNDFSTWYIRRSRERVKSMFPTSDVGKVGDKQFALATMRFVLLELSKIIAPFMPFIAEAIYKGLGNTARESVHLEGWPRAPLKIKSKISNLKSEEESINEKLLEEMEEVRKIVSLGMEARLAAGVKVKQPIASLKIKNKKSKIKNKEEFIKLIKDELNVKEVVFSAESGPAFGGDNAIGVELDTELTDELREEGELRELLRVIQSLRKKTNLTPDQKIVLRIETISSGKNFIEKFEDKIKTTVGAEKIELVNNMEDGDETRINNFIFKLKIIK